ncbi:hypothetical protein HK098_006392 [Nowakowskiella sp. JEL0407]|nr:hypothetical protein HK098_006392 [Nowakowskiella sp. JEL0407]
METDTLTRAVSPPILPVISSLTNSTSSILSRRNSIKIVDATPSILDDADDDDDQPLKSSKKSHSASSKSTKFKNKKLNKQFNTSYKSYTTSAQSGNANQHEPKKKNEKKKSEEFAGWAKSKTPRFTPDPTQKNLALGPATFSPNYEFSKSPVKNISKVSFNTHSDRFSTPAVPNNKVDRLSKSLPKDQYRDQYKTPSPPTKISISGPWFPTSNSKLGSLQQANATITNNKPLKQIISDSAHSVTNSYVKIDSVLTSEPPNRYSECFLMG